MQAKADVDEPALLRWSRQPAPVFRAIADAGVWTCMTAEPDKFESPKEEGPDQVPSMRADPGSASEPGDPCLTADRDRALEDAMARASPELLPALEELRRLETLVDAMRSASTLSATAAAGSDVPALGTHEALEEGDVTPGVMLQAPAPLGRAQASLMRSAEGADLSHERLEASLCFFEGFHAAALSGREELQILQDGVTRLRAALTLPPGVTVPEQWAIAVNPAQDIAADLAPDGRLPTEDEWLDALAAHACEALVAGVPPQVLLMQLAGRFGPAPAGAGGLGMRPGKADAARPPRAAAEATAQAGVAGVGEALRRAAERLSPTDGRKAHLESLLAAHGKVKTDEGVSGGTAAMVSQEVQAAHERIDAQHAAETPPLAALRAL